MSRETSEWLNGNIMVGFTKERGNAWWDRNNGQGKTTNGNPNHFEGAVPTELVLSDLFPWEPITAPLFARFAPELTADGVSPAREVAVPGKVGVFRSDTGELMGVHGEDYVPHSYRRWLIDAVASIIDTSKGDLGIGSAGVLRGGSVGWVQIDAPESLTTPEGVEYRPHILATTSLDGSIATTYGRCTTIVVCDNTRDAALGQIERGGGGYVVKHTKHSELRIMEAREALGILHQDGETFAQQVAELSAVKVSARQFGKFLDGWAPMPTADGNGKLDARAVTVAEKKREAVTTLYRSDPRVAPWTRTGFGVLQAVNTYNQHMTQIRDGSGGHGIGGKRYARSVLMAADGTLRKAEADARKLLVSVTS
jgi:phage/plasmid-like protein (TIGR03299 family)